MRYHSAPMTPTHAAKMIIRLIRALRARLPGSVGDPQVVPGWIKDPEVLQAPRTVLKVLRQWPSRRRHPIALSSDVINLEHQLHPSRRHPGGTGIWNCPPGGSDTHAAPLQRNIRIRLVPPIGDEAETQDAHIEIDGGVKVIREDLEPHRHLHHWMVAYRIGSPRRQP